MLISIENIEINNLKGLFFFAKKTFIFKIL